MKLYELHALIAATCPIIGINTDGVIWFKEEATQDQRESAQALMDSHLSDIQNGE
jgi:hypothetical protein